MYKNLIKKIIKEEIEGNDKLYSLYRKLYFKNFDEYTEHAAQIFIDASRKNYYFQSGKVIETGEECLMQPYCLCSFIKENIKWSDDMMNNKSILLRNLDKEFTDEKTKDNYIFDLMPYSFMKYGFTAYECMSYYGKLFRELYQKHKCY